MIVVLIAMYLLLSGVIIHTNAGLWVWIGVSCIYILLLTEQDS